MVSLLEVVLMTILYYSLCMVSGVCDSEGLNINIRSNETNTLSQNFWTKCRHTDTRNVLPLIVISVYFDFQHPYLDETNWDCETEKFVGVKIPQCEFFFLNSLFSNTFIL
jgi:hypothetical protein